MGSFNDCTCPVCGAQDALAQYQKHVHRQMYDCNHCGPFEIGGPALFELVGMSRSDRMAWLEAARSEISFSQPVPLVSIGQVRPTAA
ncbi:hypothetical protein L1787_13020 [Acuticoccus sp. M5D2P5]|uniref:hypothetical protein n=1 Tax=Acuticoccus kalidii TaxID=2910977 RepID=UPI001F1E4E4B|nr:hypothetical protein [Acuticoccus kalidii]MCF3934331.1 hypothetical protein [Acuticoccus kalidii]